MTESRDRVALQHPKLPGRVINPNRRSVPAYLKRGWIEAKSPEAKAVVEASPSNPDSTPSKED